ncbi:MULTISPECIES: LLM class flavin-dependent oxidoreductase [unclassified Streptomyces]|uniref:LLM class flavin-dependent oxidoreductase n=1 Tax=unclassified Streptomyces TaxID=2593676 RepID=UPI0037F69506
MTSSAGRGLLHLAAAVDQPGAYGAAPYVELARLAERGGLDFVTLDDTFARPGPDAPAVLSRVAPATHRIGLVPTVTTTHTEPFHVQAAVAALDWVSRGRAGWRIDVSTTEGEARLFGRRHAAAPDALWREAGEVADVAARLWDSWEDGAERPAAGPGRATAPSFTDRPFTDRSFAADQSSAGHVPAQRPATEGPFTEGTPAEGQVSGAPFGEAPFTDPEKLHHVDFTGTSFSVRGPATVPRPPQGHPVRVVDATDGPARATAARYADVVLIRVADPARARSVRDALRAEAAEAGRDPRTLRVLVSLLIDLGDGEHAADPGHGGGGPRATAQGPLYRGGPVDLADLIATWHREGAADGFHLTPLEPRRDLERLVNGTVALLQHRGLFRTFYPGSTLREHLGLGRPANRYAEGAR